MSGVKDSVSARIREFWPVVRALRCAGMSWRQLPEYMWRNFGVPRVTHSAYLKIAREKRELGLSPIPSSLPGHMGQGTCRR